MNKFLGLLLVGLALVVGVVPVLTDCWAHGRALTTTTGMTIPMRCHWTALAEIGLAVPLGLVGLMSLTRAGQPARRPLAVLGLALGALVILFPLVIIGVCANAAMPCNLIEKPALLLAGGLALAASLGLLALPGARRAALVA
jgi:hypothetical protein